MSRIKGPPPTEGSQHQAKNGSIYPKVPVNWDGEKRGPELPEGFNWGPITIAWWEKWRNSPQSMVMLDSDWSLMLETALLVEMLWYPSSRMGAVSATQLAAEIRRRVAAYGASFEDRTKLRMEITTPQMLSREEADIADA